MHYYDSIEHDKSVQPLAYFEHLKRWIEDEARTKLNNDSYRADDFAWNDHNEAPFQTNTYDCGVFVLMAIHYIVNDLPFDYNTDEGRQYIATVCRSKIAVMIFRESINKHNERYMPIVLDDD
jgi:Ulp1 family protease